MKMMELRWRSFRNKILKQVQDDGRGGQDDTEAVQDDGLDVGMTGGGVSLMETAGPRRLLHCGLLCEECAGK